MLFPPGHDRLSAVMRIKDPHLWFPRGLGDQPLYQLDAELVDADRRADRRSAAFGIRTVNLNRKSDKTGESFEFQINDRPVYARGANWIPLSLFPGSPSPQQYENLLTAARDANMNMLRVWGGGYYEDDLFYELCDKFGIMVWQDFMFACSYYPDRQWFLNEVTTEATQTVERLRNHPSIVLWCGNNEIDWLHEKQIMGTGKKFHGKSIFHKLMPQIVAENDPDRPYIPSTPFGPPKDANTPRAGTVHQWDVWAFHAPSRSLTDPSNPVPRFVTEFGIQSAPSMHVIKRILAPDRMKPAALELEKHDYHLDGVNRLWRYLTELFPPQTDIGKYVYVTQLAQARQVTAYIEYLRANSIKNRGVLFWQLNDCCPAISWSAVDCLNQRKALYHYVTRAFADVLVTVVPEYETSRANVAPQVAALSTVIVNDSANPVTATLQCTLSDFNANTIDSLKMPVSVAPRTTSSPFKLPRALARPERPRSSVLRISLENNGCLLTERLFLYMPDKYLEWPPASISVAIHRLDDQTCELNLKTDTLAKDVQIIADVGHQLSDNFFDLLPSRPMRITVRTESPNPAELKYTLLTAADVI
jgi:beta-mannosidase